MGYSVYWILAHPPRPAVRHRMQHLGAPQAQPTAQCCGPGGVWRPQARPILLSGNASGRVSSCHAALGSGVVRRAAACGAVRRLISVGRAALLQVCQRLAHALRDLPPHLPGSRSLQSCRVALRTSEGILRRLYKLPGSCVHSTMTSCQGMNAHGRHSAHVEDRNLRERRVGAPGSAAPGHAAARARP